MALIMTRWGKSPDGQAQWRIGTEDGSRVRFPTTTQLNEILKKCGVCKRSLVVVERQDNNILVQAPEDLSLETCDEFLSELWWQMVFE
jgi:hypothetical protein